MQGQGPSWQATRACDFGNRCNFLNRIEADVTKVINYAKSAGGRGDIGKAWRNDGG
jgi:hypothetical protein